MIRFNSLNPQLFNAHADEFNGVERERANIVTCGRLLMMEHNGRGYNSLKKLQNKAEEYSPVLANNSDKNSYAETNRNLQSRLFLYCAKRYCSLTGETAPADMNEFRQQQRKFLSDKTYLKMLAGVIRDIVTPMMPVVLSNGLEWLAETVTTPIGQTYELDVQSNDIFIFEDDSWGASRSKPQNQLYSYPVTLNPTLRTSRSLVKWYQYVGNNADMGRLFNAFAAGMYNKIVALWTNAMSEISNNTMYLPANLKFTNTSANWVTAASRVSMLSGGSYRSVIGIGHPSALTKALPSGVVNASTVNLDSALSTMLGIEWAKYGFLGEYMGINLMPINDVVVPGTQNTTVTGLVPTTQIWVVPTIGYKPVYICMEEGSPIQIEIDPYESADMTWNVTTSISIDVEPVVASKIAMITA